MESTKGEGFDCRKVIRMAAFGLDQEVIDSCFVWICTGCQRCEMGCPMGIKLVKVWGAAKAARPRDKVPGVLHKGVDMCLKTGNNKAPVIPLHLHLGFQERQRLKELKTALMTGSLEFVQIALDNAARTSTNVVKILQRACKLLDEAMDRLVCELCNE